MATCPVGLVCGVTHSIPATDAGEAECSRLSQEPHVSLGAQQGEASVLKQHVIAKGLQSSTFYWAQHIMFMYDCGLVMLRMLSSQVVLHESLVANWTRDQKARYMSVHYIDSNQSVSEPDARQQALYV